MRLRKTYLLITDKFIYIHYTGNFMMRAILSGKVISLNESLHEQKNVIIFKF